MFWRLEARIWIAQKGEANRRALQRLACQDKAHGMLAYNDDGDAVGWCAVGPYSEYGRLRQSRLRRRSQSEPRVWCIPCLFVQRGYRKRGVSVALINEATKFAFAHGATAVEAYPTTPPSSNSPPPSRFTGTLSAFSTAGFSVIDEPFKNRKLVRRLAGKRAKENT